MINGNAGGSAYDVVLQYSIQKDNGRVEDNFRLIKREEEICGAILDRKIRYAGVRRCF